MNISVCKKPTLVTLFLFSIITHTFSNTNDIPQPTPQKQASASEEAEQRLIFQHLLDRRLTEFKTIDCVLEELLLLIDHSTSVVKIRKRELRDNALGMRDLITSIINEPFAQIDPQSLHFLGCISRDMANHLIRSLDKHLETLPPFDLEKVMTRYTPLDIGPEELAQDFAKNARILKTLQEKAGTAGLRWYNKAYRVFDRWVIQPGEKYHLGKRCRLLAKVSLLGGWLWWHTDSHDAVLRGWFGYSPRMTAGNSLNTEWHNRVIEDQPGAIKSTALTPAKTRTLKWPGELEALLIEGKLGYAPIGAYLAYDVWTETTPELSSGTSFFSKKFYKLHNFLKGGTYRHHFEKPDEKYAVNPRITFKDIIGMNHAKEILSVIVKYMENPETFDGRKLTPEKGYLLTGPTRTGKTFIVEGLAGEIKEMYKRKGKRPEDFHFFVLNANFILQGGIKSLIEEAKALSPCILFIDEIDLLSLQRGSGNAALLSEFLTAMSGALENDPDKVVIIIAATNKPENLDIALRQRGRLGKEIRFEYPNYQERKEFFERRISKLANLNNFDIPQLARETEGKSFEDMNALIRTAFQRGILRGQTLTHKLLEASLDEEVRNIIMSDSTLSPEEKQLVAIHMAGQALAVVLLKNEQLAKVTIKPFLANVKEESAFDQFYKHELQQQKKIKNGRIYTFRQHDTKNINSYTQKLALCQQALAGFAAEKIILGACGYSNHPESGQQALDIATSIIAEGIDIHNQHFPQELKAKYLEKALALKKKCDEEITALLERHKEALQAITQALIEKETLTGKEVMEIAGLKVE